MRTDRGRRSREHERRLAAVLSEVKPSAWAAVAAALVALVVMTILSARDHADPRVADEFPPEDVEAAKIKVLPYRQSGLIFSWGNAESTILVDGVLWDRLPRDTRQDLGQAMAIAKNARVVRLRDSRTNSLIAICTAAGRCRGSEAEEPELALTPAREPPSRD